MKIASSRIEAANHVAVRAAARELARNNLHGYVGEPLPNLMSAESVRYINANLEAFQHMVSIERIIWQCVKSRKRERELSKEASTHEFRML